MLTILLLFSTLSFAFDKEELARYGVSEEEAAENPADTALYLQGKYPHPVAYRLPEKKPLSQVAELGKVLFHDASFSASGKLSCAGCHVPSNAFGPPADMKTVMYGGPQLDLSGFRPPPTLRYLYRQNGFRIGPDMDDDDLGLSQQPPPEGTVIAVKTANGTATSAMNMVPQGGLFLDGRASTLQEQADGPLMSPFEMAAPSHAWLAERLKTPYYETVFKQLFGPGIYGNQDLLIAQMEFALARYQIEDQEAFYPFTSKYDDWVQGKATLTPAEMRGFFAFTDPKRGNCAACHLARPGRDGLPPLFTDQQYEAFGVPRNVEIPANRNPDWYDLGLCGPFREDFKQHTQYCGFFRTPTLRNIARRKVYFHNARYTTLEEVMDFYNFRDIHPEKIYPKDAAGQVLKYNDLPKQYWKNVDTVNPPFDKKLGEKPAMSEQDEKDIVTFLKTLSDRD